MPRKVKFSSKRSRFRPDLVRPTVTATAAARIQVIEQRVMTRDNLLTIVDKFQVFAEHRNWFGGVTTLSGTEALDLARKRAQIKPIELEIPKSTWPEQSHGLRDKL